MIFKLQFPTILLLESLAMEINCLKTSSIKGCTNPGCQINFLSWWLIFVAPQKICWFMSPSQQLEFWKTDGPNLSAKILSCQGNYIYCVTMNAGAFYSEYKFSLSIQKFSSWSTYSKTFYLHKMSSGDACQQNNETLKMYRMTTVSILHAHQYLDSAVLKCSPKTW